ncbi:hypothetical protein PoB_002896700 [Plakobranchus ocellatus]|uniref:Uncharacterized protein n=1 Tax=Plakobranchus ocellatus TaxID=259542 RepID=A0AAV4A6D9_9GAST|nr:hypothetical protein PoB_002896700 [Plakobranchus ocellatus]
MDQMAHAISTKRKTYNMLHLSTIAARVVFWVKYPVDSLSHEDARQRFNMDIGKALAHVQIMKRSSVLSLQKPARDNIETVLKFLHSGVPG